MTLLKIAITLLLCLTPLFAQTASRPAATDNTLDCTTVDSSPGCNSFNEMVLKKDKELLDALNGVDITYACFEKSRDSFVMIAVQPAEEYRYQKTRAPSLVTQSGWMFFQRYNDGVSEGLRLIVGAWTKGPAVPEYFSADSSNKEATASFTEDEVTVGFSYENLGKTKTDYTMSIRRSTLRFLETYRFPSENNKTTNSSTDTGHCALVAKPKSASPPPQGPPA